MTRRTNGPEPAHTVRNGSSSGEIPTSTIAAKIVHSHHDATTRQEPESKQLFGQLLQEYLDDAIGEDAVEKSVETNAKLISIVVEAGLDSLLKDNPFAQDLLLPQAADSLKVIKIAIERNPEVLFYRDGRDGQPQLYLWLIPTMLSLFGRKYLSSLQESLMILFSTIMGSLAHSPTTLQSSVTIGRLLVVCVSEITRTLSISSKAEDSASESHKVVLPSVKSIIQAWPEAQHLIVLPQTCQAIILSPLQSAKIGLALIRLLVLPSYPVYEVNVFDCPYQWALDHINTLVQSLEILRSTTNSQDDLDLLLSTACILSKDIIAQIEDSAHLPSPSDRCALSLGAIIEVLFLVVQNDSMANTQKELAKILLVIQKGSLHRSRMLLLLKRNLDNILANQIVKNTHFEVFTSDLQTAISCVMDQRTTWPEPLTRRRTLLFNGEGDQFEDFDLREAYKNLSVDVDNGFHEFTRPCKRQRTIPTTINDEESSLEFLQRAVTSSFRRRSGEDQPTITGDNFTTVVSQMVAEEVSHLLVILSQIPCEISRTMKIDQHDNVYYCQVCDRGSENDGDAPTWPDDLAQHTSKLLTLVLDCPVIQHSKLHRILAAIVIRRMALHSSSLEMLSVSRSSLAQWCLRSLRSSSRELRVVSGQSLMAFLRNGTPRELLSQNRRYVIQYVRELTQKNDISIQHTLALTWGQIARVCGDEERHVSILQLVEFLGHSHPLVCGVAFNELELIAEDLGRTPEELMRPFWRTVAPNVVRDLHTRPQKAQQLCDFLGISINQLLISTQKNTLPYLVLEKQTDILKRIASVRGPDSTVENTCMQPRNFAAILAVLLLHHQSANTEESVMRALCQAAPGFEGNDLSTLVKLEPIPTACELLKAAGDQSSNTESRHHQAIQTLAVLTSRQPGQSKALARPGKLMITFLENHIIGIIHELSEIIENASIGYPTYEKLRALRAIGEVIRLARELVSIVLPQLRACLQAALAIDELRDWAFDAWSALLEVLDEEDVGAILSQTFAIIVQEWSCFSSQTQELANAAVQKLLKDHNGLIREHIDSLPSLASIPIMSKLDGELSKFKSQLDPDVYLTTFSRRCEDENAVVVVQALRELLPHLVSQQRFIHELAGSQLPNPVIAELYHSLFEACARFSDHAEIPTLCSECMGVLGYLDPNRIEFAQTKRDILILSNFGKEQEVIDFVAFMLETILVKAFTAANNSRAQNFLAYVIQELMKFCRFAEAASLRPRASQPGYNYTRWIQIPDAVRSLLSPYLSSKFILQSNAATQPLLVPYPKLKVGITHGIWVRDLVFDLLQRANGDNPKMLFPLLARVIRGQSLSIAEFILPFAALNTILGGTEIDSEAVLQELLLVLHQDVHDNIQDSAGNSGDTDTVQYNLAPDDAKKCSESVFQILDYLARWLQAKRKAVAELKTAHTRGSHNTTDMDLVVDIAQISNVERFLSRIPADVVSRRARECGSANRAVFYWEQHMRQEKDKSKSKGEERDDEDLYSNLASMYVDLEEPDGMEGLLACISFFDEEKQALADEKAGRWTAAQSWHEVQLAHDPSNVNFQQNILFCLSQSGRFEASANFLGSLENLSADNSSLLLPFAAEAAWNTNKLQLFEKVSSACEQAGGVATQNDFDVLVAKSLICLRDKDSKGFKQTLDLARELQLRTVLTSKPTSYRTASGNLLQMHALYEIATLAGRSTSLQISNELIIDIFDRRLDAMGAHPVEKQYILGLRRATLLQSALAPEIVKKNLVSAWLTSARLSRKANHLDSAYNAVLHAAEIDGVAATLEHCRLLWQDGHHRKAIQTLQGALRAELFTTAAVNIPEEESITSLVSDDSKVRQPQNLLLAKAQLLLAKWTDAAGQSGEFQNLHNYHEAIRSCMRWDKCHYYLGKYYLKLLEHDKQLPISKQNRRTKSGENVKLIIDNFLRSMGFGAKYNHETVPKLLTLWLDLGLDVHQTGSRQAREPDAISKSDWLDRSHAQLKKYVDKLAPWIFYTAFPQMMSRINHPNPKVWEILSLYIMKVSSAYPQQTLWSLLAASKATGTDRAARAGALLNKLRDGTKKTKVANASVELRTLITQGSRLSEALLHACESPVEQRTSHVSLSRELGFSHRLAPCGLVVPVEATMNAIMPTVKGYLAIRSHKPFARGTVTIASFNDEVLVLSSLQRPRKITVKGSDGVTYGLLCKPKDDLRKDQRLMEFNAMIDRSLKKDVDASSRRLYTKTYGVTPLNEECGIIEWVDGLKPMRDIIIGLYKQKNIRIDYNSIRQQLTDASAGNLSIFTDVVLPHFQPVLYEWFIDTFPEPERWFNARLQYTRSCAVTSITGHILGLGDRHGENVLLEEGSGGAFHVDFNCLFDKGLTFEKPELVPFRLTHNMVDAFGAYGVEGPFRKSAELTLKILRQHEDTLMTILETFLYDPTADFLGKKKRSIPGVPETPQEVLDSVRGKVRGLWRGESVPLSVEGYVDSLIRVARDPANLAAMYIGWCAFF